MIAFDFVVPISVTLPDFDAVCALENIQTLSENAVDGCGSATAKAGPPAGKGSYLTFPRRNLLVSSRRAISHAS
ncbi:hypothetical protein [Rhizobium etli]|uniref:hypothetical protein n=1 Tax=Rhizobium etli TaxID=29449 RepID=UPI00038391CB|nr:hypothetical protein [Rhizobium etli]AGS25908.1 hypothetical protein REMIM1_PF00240 [Rhizobium etli bv. mimosae str. Mim1]